MSGSPTVGQREVTELIGAGLVSLEDCRSFLSTCESGRRPRRLMRLCRKVLRNPANARVLLGSATPPRVLRN
jgi:hypothetical protein